MCSTDEILWEQTTCKQAKMVLIHIYHVKNLGSIYNSGVQSLIFQHFTNYFKALMHCLHGKLGQVALQYYELYIPNFDVLIGWYGMLMWRRYRVVRLLVPTSISMGPCNSMVIPYSIGTENVVCNSRIEFAIFSSRAGKSPVQDLSAAEWRLWNLGH